MKKGVKCFVADPALAETDVYALGTVVSEGKDAVTVEMADGSKKEWKMDSVLQATTNPEYVKDHTMLDVLNEATLLENTRRGFASDKIYNYINEILLVSNPFKRIEGLYDSSVMDQYKGCNWTKMPPHIFATAEMAFTHMTGNAQSQSLLVAGESGAGKTETNKQLLSYLIFRAGVHSGSPNAAHLASDIQGTNPVLEAFGNSKTIRNNNSSRFGKYINLKFSGKYQIMGAETRTFLLEKSRVTSTTNAGERSYHIFYQLLGLAKAGTASMDDFSLNAQDKDAKMKKSVGDVAKEFIYLNLNKDVLQETPAIDDSKDGKEMHDAMISCGLSEEDRAQVYKMLAAVLLMGNAKFVAKGDDECELDADGMGLIKKVQELLSIDDISKALVVKVIEVAGSKIEKSLTAELATKQRDAFAKHIFSLLFDTLVLKMNNKIDTKVQFHKFVGLLDVFGFEVFAVNSFEQLCINYANERLHNFFLMRVFEVEIELYRMQSLEVPKLDYPDNAKVIELLEKSPTGIFPTLDAQCKMPKATDKTFNEALIKQLGPDAKTKSEMFDTLSHAKIKGVHLKDDECFVVKHFAAAVCYTAMGFLEKNADALSPAFTDALKASKSEMVRSIIPSDGAIAPEASTVGSMSARRQTKNAAKEKEKGGPTSSSVGKKFLLSLKQLMREIATTHPYFVRCLKPNNTLKPGDFNSSMVLRQLKCSGTIECVKLMQAGYPSRAPYKDLRARFKGCLPEEVLGGGNEQFVELLLSACDCEKEDYQMGQDMVFFKGSKGSVLQDLSLMKKDDLAMAIVDGIKKKGPAKFKNFTADQLAEHSKKLTVFVEKRKKDKQEALIKLTNAFHATSKLFDWISYEKKRIAEVERLRKEAEEKKRQEEEEQRKAAEKIQAMKKGNDARKEVEEYKEKKAKGEEVALPEGKSVDGSADSGKPSDAEAAPEVVTLSLEEQLAASREHAAKSQADEMGMTPEQMEVERKWFYTLPKDWPEAPVSDARRFHKILMCKGVEWGFQYHNFYGDWELDEEIPLCNGRPHYKHNTMYGGYAHLFHCMDPHYHVPRWVIGPAPGNENGWAFAESDASLPHEVAACWISWDGFEWHTCKNFRYQSKEHELDGLSDEEDYDEAMEQEEFEKHMEEQRKIEEAEEKAKQEKAKKEAEAAKPAANSRTDPSQGAEKKEDPPAPSSKGKGKKEDKKAKKEDKKKGGKKGGLFSKK